MVNELSYRRNVLRRITGAICAGVLCAIFVAGFWPFHAPKNQVDWIGARNGIRFGRRGIVVSASPFSAAPRSSPGTLEILVEPGSTSASGTILAFDDAPDPADGFALRQFEGSLAIQRPGFDPKGNLDRAWWRTHDVFENGKGVVLTIASTQGKSFLYVDGVPAGDSSDVVLAPQDFTGKLVLGSSMVRDSWSGQISGLAIYDATLTPAEIKEHSTFWLRGQSPIASGEDRLLALYRFDERGGNVVDDRSHGGNSLVIPDRYFVVHPGFLTPVSNAFRSRWDGWMTWSYWSDALVNISGFVPLGFLFTAWFCFSRPVSQARMMTVILGFTLSLAIESVQYFLPTRDSNMTDLLNNTLGTVIGVALCRPALLGKISIGPAA